MMQNQDKARQARQYDLFSRDFKSDPFPTFARLRAEAPIHAHQAPDGTTIWYITRYEDSAAVLRDDVNFCKDPRNAFEARAQDRAAKRSSTHHRINENMLFSDPPDHTRLRSLVSQAFTPRRINDLAPRVQAIAAELLEQVAPQAHMDLIAAYALPLPVFVICDMLGIPQADRDRVADWSQAIISPGSRNLNYSARKQKVRAFTAYLDAMFSERKARPRDDLVTALVQAEESGDRFSDTELSSMVALLLVTGHETTVNLIGNGTLALLQHPWQLTLLREEPSLWPAAVEELLRYDGPVETSTSRWARRDVRFAGHPIKRGDQVRVVLTSANRDENQFVGANQLDIQREENKHLAFGLGIHYCLGAPLARLEGRIALRHLFTRLPRLRLANPDAELAWRSGVLFRGLERLDVQWEHKTTT